MPWKLWVNPIEKHVNSISTGKFVVIFFRAPLTRVKNFRGPLFASGPPYKCLWTVPKILEFQKNLKKLTNFGLSSALDISVERVQIFTIFDSNRINLMNGQWNLENCKQILFVAEFHFTNFSRRWNCEFKSLRSSSYELKVTANILDSQNYASTAVASPGRGELWGLMSPAHSKKLCTINPFWHFLEQFQSLSSLQVL